MIARRTLFYLLLLTVKRGESYSWYSTIGELRNLVQNERKILEDLKNAFLLANTTVNLLLTQIETIKNIPVESVNNKGNETISYDRHRVNYNRWFNQQLSYLQRDILPLEDSHMQTIYNEMKSFPTEDDLEIVYNVLLDLQKMYNLKANDLARGYIMNSFTGASLTPKSCYELTKMACTETDIYDHEMCHEWYQEVVRRINETAYHQYDLDKLERNHENMKIYSNLCAASTNQTYIENASNSNLKCFLWDNHHHPRLVLQPIRTELLSTDPTIVLFHGAISDKIIEHLENEAATKLDTATTGNDEDTIDIHGLRIAHNFWLEEPNDKVVRYLDQFAEAITGLVIDDFSDYLQIANYGVGGHYKPHYDASVSQGVIRRATLMYYLTDVQYGGATAFIHPRIAVRPEKGSAVLWHNLLFDTGLLDDRTMHGSCPVLLGNKWVANKWIWDGWHGICHKHEYDFDKL